MGAANSGKRKAVLVTASGTASRKNSRRRRSLENSKEVARYLLIWTMGAGAQRFSVS
jgi:hypothetical protein